MTSSVNPDALENLSPIWKEILAYLKLEILATRTSKTDFFYRLETCRDSRRYCLILDNLHRSNLEETLEAAIFSKQPQLFAFEDLETDQEGKEIEEEVALLDKVAIAPERNLVLLLDNPFCLCKNLEEAKIVLDLFGTGKEEKTANECQSHSS